MFKYRDIELVEGRLVITGVDDTLGLGFRATAIPIHVSDAYEMIREMRLLGDSEDINKYSIEFLFRLIGAVTDDAGCPILIKTPIGTYLLYIQNVEYLPITEISDINGSFVDKVNSVVKEVVMNGY